LIGIPPIRGSNGVGRNGGRNGVAAETGGRNRGRNHVGYRSGEIEAAEETGT